MANGHADTLFGLSSGFEPAARRGDCRQCIHGEPQDVELRQADRQESDLREFGSTYATKSNTNFVGRVAVSAAKRVALGSDVSGPSRWTDPAALKNLAGNLRVGAYSRGGFFAVSFDRLLT